MLLVRSLLAERVKLADLKTYLSLRPGDPDLSVAAAAVQQSAETFRKLAGLPVGSKKRTRLDDAQVGGEN
eukprot:291273-Prorocentrum_minimum.AAC.1